MSKSTATGDGSMLSNESGLLGLSLDRSIVLGASMIAGLRMILAGLSSSGSEDDAR